MFTSKLIICTIAIALFGQSEANNKRGACYSPMHSDNYNKYVLYPSGLGDDIDNDMYQMSQYVTHIRTFYSDNVGYDLVPYAAQYGLKVYLGVYMVDDTSSNFWQRQMDAAVDAAVYYNDTVEAIFVGNENLYPNGDYYAADIIERLEWIKDNITANCPDGWDCIDYLKFGTVQRVTEYKDDDIADDVDDLADYCDILGVNIYPFYSSGYDSDEPTKILNSLWEQMIDKFGEDKVVLTETGWPTDGEETPNCGNEPGYDNALNYYEGFLAWEPDVGSGPFFWYSFYDRNPTDSTVSKDFKYYFGFATYDNEIKADGEFPQNTTTWS